MDRKTYTKHELATVLAEHQKWLTTRWNEAAEGSRADLTGAVLRGADLTRAVLRDADLTGAVLRGADLAGADLAGADLTRAVLRGADLTGAVLAGAVLAGADLTGADLTGAVLRGADLGDGIRWEQYKTEVVPALCVAGGKTLDETANPETWGCHSWKSDRLRCPMAVAFDADRIADVPPLYRALANDFIQYFDAGIIPLGEVNPKYAEKATVHV